MQFILILFFITSSYAQISWLVATPEAEFQSRSRHTSILFDNKIWAIGGYDKNEKPLSDIWCSKNGKDWTRILETVPFVMRVNTAIISFQGYLWALGGYNGL